jgi:hypothetical protein
MSNTPPINYGPPAAREASRHIVREYKRVFDHADTDINVAATSAVINLGDPLPADAIVIGVIADVTQDWADAGAGTFSADVGVASGDDDRFTPTALDIDGGVAELGQTVLLQAGGTQLAVTFTGSVNLSTLVTGTMTLRVFFVQPFAYDIAAP